LRYLKDKQVIISKQDTELLSEEEKRKTADQLGNVKRIIKDIYDRREKKIVSIAIDKCKNKNSIIDKSVFLNEESVLFDNVVSILDSSRSNILNNLINLKDPVSSGSFNPVVGDKKEAALPKEEDTKPKETKLVRFLNAVPKFVGKELEEYGPFDEEDIASLPVDIANVLINKERVEEISEN
jgi:DNA replication initiation complex subunit (GINS family)